MLTSCQETDNLVVIHTPYGDMKAVLFEDTPQHKENFTALVLEGAYDNTIFHRVISEFMIQGGDVNKKEGATDIDYTLPAEINPEHLHVKGALAAARLGDDVNPEKESSGCQFYVVQGTVLTEQELRLDNRKLQEGIYQLLQSGNPEYDSLGQELSGYITDRNYEAYQAKCQELVPVIEEELGISVSKDVTEEQVTAYTTLGGTPHLDGEYTVFGQIVEGLDIIDEIAAVATDPQGLPEEAIEMTIELEEMKRSEITEKYGITYQEKS